MREQARAARERQIEEAAYAVLEEKGYATTSMLAIAKRARASNETLYNWYGDKTGLFRALVVRNAAEVREMLQDGLDSNEPPLAVLQALGPRLLALLIGPRAIQLNRAAAADPTGELGAVISRSGRETVGPLIGELLARVREDGALEFDNREESVALYLSLLVGDLQIRRAIGHQPPLDNAAIKHRSDRAHAQFMRLRGR